MADNSFDFMKDVLAAPLGEIISSVGNGVAEAQAALDAGSLSQVLAIYNSDNKDALTTLLREVGYQPTFYAIPETEVEAQITLALSMAESYTASSPGLQNNGRIKTRIYATPVNANVNNSFNLNVNAYSKIKFKIVPIPPPNDSGELRVVPDLEGKTLGEAETILSGLGLKYNLNTTTTIPLTTVIQSQTPNAQTNLRSGDAVNLVVSLPAVLVPNLINSTVSEATQTLTSLGLQIVFGNAEVGEVLPNQIIVRQTPAAGTSLDVGEDVVVLLR